MPQYVLRLEVVNGPLRGQVVVVQDHGTLVVGRLPECGLSVPQDLTVSRQHFRMEFHSPACQLVHLSQTGETFVNGVPVSNVELRQGDEIAFGEGNKVRVAFDESREGIGTPTAVPVRAELSESKPPNGFTASITSCGWNLYESANEQLDFAKLLEILIGTQRVMTLIDFRRIGLPVPPEMVEPDYLFSWIPPSSREQLSPALASVSDDSTVADIIRVGWLKDGIVCFGSNLKGTELVAHWRKAIGVEGDQPSTAKTAYFWPSILNLILTCQSAEQVEPLLGELTWLFVEFPKSPGKWRLYTKADFTSTLTKSGLVAVPVHSPAQ